MSKRSTPGSSGSGIFGILFAVVVGMFCLGVLGNVVSGLVGLLGDIVRPIIASCILFVIGAIPLALLAKLIEWIEDRCSGDERR